jgi:hypothetical protein
MIAEFIGIEDPRWRACLAMSRHDCYHLPEYVRVAASEEGATPMAFYAEDGAARCLIPLLLRSIPDMLHAPAEWCDGLSPYGYAGILLSCKPDQLQEFLEAFRSAARARCMVSAFIRLHPLFPLDAGALGKFGRLVRHGPTVYANLSDSPERSWERVSTNHRRNITRLLRSGFRSTLDDWAQYRDFIAIYHATMHRVGAAGGYFFSSRYFDDLRALLGSQMHLACVMSAQGDVAAAGLFFATGGIVQYHLGGTAEPYLALAPSKLMLESVRRWAQGNGYELYHLGGGVGGAEDSLFHFKAGFSPLRADFYTYRMVIDEQKKAVLDRAARVLQGPTAEAETPNGFFPPYRRLHETPASGQELRPAV